MKLTLLIVAALLLIAAMVIPAAADEYEDFLSVDEIGASTLIARHPEADGRGVVIAVLDTGVDMGVEGLGTTSTGQVKVIDARDFSGEGKVALTRAFFETVGGEKVLKVKKAWLKGVEGLPLKSCDGKYFLGVLDEARFKNASLKDLNGNGRTDDEFTVVVFQAGEDRQWTAFLDRTGSHDISGAEPMRSYHESLRPFSFPSADPAKPQRLINCALTLDEEGKSVSFHIPSHSHGTHVAGICSGYMLKGRKGFDGVAPGARIVSCKISDNTLGGASTTQSMKKALEFVADYAKEHGTPVVVSMSFGVGSEVEGSADIDKLIDRFCLENPRIPVVLSAGNDGPGLSTVGCPAASYGAITVGASLTARNSRALVGGTTATHEIFSFSSRGGELAKPDVIAPGIASSAVPNYETRDLMRGTSMAAPEASGAVALLVSELVQKHPKAPWNSFMIKRALKTTAKALPGYTALDQGAGLIQADRALASLVRALKLRGEEKLMGYAVKTLCPSLPAGTSPAAFYRTAWYPGAPATVGFTVTPLFTADTTPDERKEFYRSFKLVSDAPFLVPDRDSAYINGEAPLQVRVTLDGKLTTPGVYTGRITARTEGGDDFELQATVVVPASVEREDSPSLSFPELTLRPGQLKRMFFRVPVGCGDAELHYRAPEGRSGACIFSVFDPEGRQVRGAGGAIDTVDGRRTADVRLEGGRLRPGGIYEIVALAPLTRRESSTVAAGVDFYGVRAGKARITSHEQGGLPEGKMEVENFFPKPFLGRVSAKLLGYVREEKVKMEGDTFTYKFKLNPQVRRVRTEIEFSQGDYGRFTDITATVLDGKGSSVARGSFSYRKEELAFETKGEMEGDYTLEIKGGLAADKDATTKPRITQFFYQGEGAIAFRQSGADSIALYSGYPRTLDFAFEAAPPMVPGGAKLFGEALFVNTAEGKAWLRAPLELELKKK